jgi:5'-nucleotidase/UDP-sugar diphosphatase
VRLTRSSLRISTGSSVGAACAVLTLCFGVACGAGAAATPTLTVVPTTAVPAVPAPSPQRPPLASPVASPAPVVTAATPTTAATDAAAAGDSYDVQSGDTLLTIADQFYGDGSQWRRVYDANKDVIGSDPDKLKIGMKLKIPPKQ